MRNLQLVKQSLKLPIGTTQSLQTEMLHDNSSEITLFYEDHFQVWNLDLQKKLRSSLIDETIFFWSITTFMNDMNLAFVSLLDCQPWLGTYSWTDNKINKLVDLPQEQEYYTKMVYFEKTRQLAIDARGKNHRLLIWDGSALAEQKLDENSNIERYNKDGLVIFSIQNRPTGFEIQTGINEKKAYTINGIEEGSIVAVQEYSETEAIVGVVHNTKTSSILLYSLASGLVTRTQKLDFVIDNLVRLADFWADDFWVAISTGEEQGNSHLKVQACFGDGVNEVLQCEIQTWIRYWNDFVPIITFSHTTVQCELQECHMEVVRCVVECAPKRSIYIKMMEETGILKDFGSEIVKHTINNY